jgi:hypothetical protein
VLKSSKGRENQIFNPLCTSKAHFISDSSEGRENQIFNPLCTSKAHFISVEELHSVLLKPACKDIGKEKVVVVIN